MTTRTFMVRAIAAELAVFMGASSVCAETPHESFVAALARERTVRAAMVAADASPAATLAEVRGVVAEYRAGATKFPRSGYGDSALWHAGRLSLDAFSRFHDPRDRDAGLILLQTLSASYPTSPLIAQAAEEFARAGGASPIAAAEADQDQPTTGDPQERAPRRPGSSVSPGGPGRTAPASGPQQNPPTTSAGLRAESKPGSAQVSGGASRGLGAASTASLEGWSSFQLKKTQAELDEAERFEEVIPFATRARLDDVRLPSQHDALRLSTGIGYLQGADLGVDISGVGKINGMHTDVRAFVAAGATGLEMRNERLSIFSPDGRWRGEAGSVYSELRGLARGGRVTWSAGPRWNPSLALYAPRKQGEAMVPMALAYRDRLQVLPPLRLGGELTSDGSAYLQGQYAQWRLDLTTFYRLVRGPNTGTDKGVSGGFNLGRGVTLGGAIRLSDALGDSSSRWQFTSVRVPLPGRANVALERTWWTSVIQDGSTHALVVQLPFGPARFIQRFQWGHTDYPQRVVPLGFDRRQSQTTASYSGQWVRATYHESTQWFEDGRVQRGNEFSSMLQFGRRTSLQLSMAVPNIWDPRRLRARFAQKLSPTLQVEAQYGRLSAFQSTRLVEEDSARVMVAVRKTWSIQSPSRGGDVWGRAIDQSGDPVSGALVRLGPYSVITDHAGNYRFPRVPDGTFQLAIDKKKLPVSYAVEDAPREIQVMRGFQANVDLPVVPLNAIRGRVYIDGNRNGLFDEGEGVPRVVVAVDDSVTATDATGTYAFYNRPAGRYTIRLDSQRLPKGLAPTSPTALPVELVGDRPVGGIDFTVERRDRPIIMRELPP